MFTRGSTPERRRSNRFAQRLHGVATLFFLAGLVVGPAGIPAEANESAYERFMRSHESPEGEWKELAASLPAYPDDRDLIPVPMQPADTLKVFLDKKSLSRIDDYVGRYTVVVMSPSGARNVYFEGIRCETKEYKTYALGADGAFQPFKPSAWQAIPYFERNAFRFMLYKHYICDDGTSSARIPSDVVRSLQENY